MKWYKENTASFDPMKQERTHKAISVSFKVHNNLPFMSEYTYCIWHPKIACKETYRHLLELCPELKYMFTRACVIAWYNDIYDQLDMKPNLTLLAEALDSKNEHVINQIKSNPILKITR